MLTLFLPKCCCHTSCYTLCLRVQPPILDFFTKTWNLLLKHPRREREIINMSLQNPAHLWVFLQHLPVNTRLRGREERSVQALGSPPRAGLLRLGTKALFSFIFTAALQSGSPTAACFLPGAVAPDLPLSKSACISFIWAGFLCAWGSPPGSLSGKSCLSSGLLPWMQRAAAKSLN